MSNRPERVANLMRREIAEILERDLNDPRLSTMVSVTDVELAHDLSFAKVFVSILETGKARDEALIALNRAGGYFRRALAPRLGLREVPEMRFLLDDSIEKGMRVDALLKRIERGEAVDDEERP